MARRHEGICQDLQGFKNLEGLAVKFLNGVNRSQNVFSISCQMTALLSGSAELDSERALGIAATSFFAFGQKRYSGKPGPRFFFGETPKSRRFKPFARR
jgi:hypothetical protein